MDGWGENLAILSNTGHQPASLNLQWQTMRSHWVFLSEKQEGARVRQVWGAQENKGDTCKLRYQIPTDGSFLQFFLKFHGMYWSKRALAIMWAPTLSKPWMAISITLLLWKQIRKNQLLYNLNFANVYLLSAPIITNQYNCYSLMGENCNSSACPRSAWGVASNWDRSYSGA